MNRLSLYIKTILLALGLATSTFSSEAQKSTVDTLVERFNNYRIRHLQEKFYVHTDRQLYLTGEILWLKVYSLDATLHQPLELSKIAYVELLDRDNHAVLQAKLGLTNALASGSVFLPATLTSGNYTLRVYTHWMKNFSPEFYFQKTLVIINPFQKLENQRVIPQKTAEAQFFPEGGNLIGGIKNKIAFRVTDYTGSGLDFKGAILNQANDTLVSFKPFKFGIGHFNFTPVAGAVYKGVILDKKGQRTDFTLPMVYESGYGLHLEENGDEINITIQYHSVLSVSQKQVMVFIHSRQRVSQALWVPLEQNVGTLKVSKASLFDGISHITVFDETSNPVCERLYYNHGGKQLKIEPAAMETVYGKRQKVTLSFVARPDGKQNSRANLSISVTKKDSLSMEQGSILSYLWLHSDLRGQIESPEYYLNESNPDVREVIDNLMLTHGWRRFTWTDVLNKSKEVPLLIPELRGHFIKGKVTEGNGAPAIGIESYLAAPGKHIQLRGTRSNVDGEVRFEMRNFVGTKKVVAQIQTKKDSLHRIEILSPWSTSFSTTKLPPFVLSPALEKQLLYRSVAMQVQDIFYKEKSEHFTQTNVDSAAFYGKPDEIYKLDDYTRFPVMEEVLREYVTGVLVRRRNDGFHFMMLDKVNRDVLREDPLILLDGLPVFDVDRIMAFDPIKVWKIDLIDRKYFMGPLIFQGIVSFQTYQGDLGGFQLDPKAVVLDYEGLQLQREFYKPIHEKETDREARLPDRRSLLFWEPFVVTDENGLGKVEFYTSDLTGEFTATIEGVTQDGAAGSQRFSFTVK